MVEGYAFFVGKYPDPVYDFPGAYSGPTDTLAIVLAGPSSIEIYSSSSITFLLGVSNVFAYATATIFVYPASLLSRILSTVRDVLVSQGLKSGVGQAGGKGFIEGSGITQVGYDRETGEILLMHDVVALPGVQLPSESELVRAAGELVGRTGLVSQRVAFSSVATNAIKAGTGYTIDVKTQRLIARSERQLNATDSQAGEPKPEDGSNRS
ncbi:MAG TPA: hypothetical protein VMT53_08130 [Terriglobales bacterium]|nr:hypothetical protein [Terriglobales bacterium]